jgi:NADPH-dependent glutamate synthase beta subunit-like oxidoreductase/flavodoxin
MLVEPRSPAVTTHPAQLEFDRTETRRAISDWSQALTEASRCLDCPDPTCVRGCPAHNDIPGFIRALAVGDLDEAHRVLRRTSVLPDICSRVCDQALQCEGACSWSLAGDAPVAIGALERFIADNAPVPPLEVPEAGETAPVAAGLEVAVVGSGPAAMAAAAELIGAGAAVTVFEREDQPGGLCRWGIPDFTLPEPVAQRPWRDLQAAGVVLHTGHEVDARELEELPRRYDAVVVAAGATEPLRPRLDGADLGGVWDASQFLHAAQHALATGTPMDALAPRPGDDGSLQPAKVLVLGAGNTAMDVARSARRLGAAATCVDWMDRRFAPVRSDELDEAAAEGVQVHFSVTVRHLEGRDGEVVSAILAATEQHAAGELPHVLEHKTWREPVDLVVFAMGYRIAPELADSGRGLPVSTTSSALPDRTWLASGLLAEPAPPAARGRPVGRLALARERALAAAALPRRERTWFVGDALTGPATVVEAMAQGKVAARAIGHHRPRRPGHASTSRRRVLVGVESRGGSTAAAARTMADRLRSDGAEVKTLPLAKVGPDALAWADFLVVGTWVEGAVVARVGPARATARWLDDLPPLPGLPVALFCSYAVAPKGTLALMRERVEARGARVVGQAALRRGGSSAEIEAFVTTVLRALSPTST